MRRRDWTDQLSIEFCETRLAAVVENKDGVDHGGYSIWDPSLKNLSSALSP